MNNNGKGYKAFTVFNYIFMCLVILVMLYPMLYVVLASFSTSSELIKHMGPLWYPLKPTGASYLMVFKNPMIFTGYVNTIIIVLSGVLLNMTMTALTAYVLSRKRLALRKFFTLFIVITMYFGGGMVPVYLTVKQLGLDNSLLALIIPTAMSAYNMIIMRTAMQSIPESLIESACIDGAKQIQVLIKIVLPLVMPTIAVLILYYAVGHWNSWFNAMLYLRDRAKFPLQLVLREILITNDTNLMSGDTAAQDSYAIAETVQYAVIVVATMPILAIYPFLQKYFVKGVMVGAVKE
ncbi:MAG: carbohydrate ABC transporter permease [Clostridia bacterium]|nr:carbohydrate ABC transporter permease [Clostridia bacterium]